MRPDDVQLGEARAALDAAERTIARLRGLPACASPPTGLQTCSVLWPPTGPGAEGCRGRPLAHASTAVLEDESGPLAEELSEARIEREGGLVDPVGQMRGYNGLDDRFAVMTASFTFRIDKSPTTCWNR